ncbi:MAG: methyl-viologen-reducing hydrogenase subunit delta [Deltaproteobacteria bacterium HGW-Deltaproteobacteria-15]|jgi:Fe-S oxidoreductase/coenzyme F420-reducing hydrogenase delta subunit|nr:MAG: methyl-viologen-reducing hydrogenase subunit delta [Deltaproteobacteria bacterium HGW-Deltaproteobacteria-15]
MKEFKIILFLCNWGPHAAYQTLQERRADIPPEIMMVRIPCSGRITKALLFKPFELGADGVILLGCKPGSCRYGTGTVSAVENTDDTRRILELLGLGQDRMQLGSFLADEPDELLSFLKEFTGRIRELGKSPISLHSDSAIPKAQSLTPREIVAAHDVFACQDCGKCTSACSLALAGKPFSPRFVAAETIAGRADTSEVRALVNGCLTCGVCYERCPSAVNFPEFIKDMRAYYRSREFVDAPAHGGFFQSMMRAMTSKELSPRRWLHLPKTIRTRPESPVLFFGGCASYFDIFFRKFLGVQTGRILEDSLRLLNFFDVEPVLLQDERCCGHDLLWSGDRANFLRLAEINAKSIMESGAEELITACPECCHTLKTEYARNGIALPVKITHMHEFLEREIEKGAVAFKPLGLRATFQDACRQSRLGGDGALPRKLLQRLCAGDAQSSVDSEAVSICCGNSAWTGCDAFSKLMQVQRLQRARQSGSELMITACPKCQIHLRCAMEDPLRGEELKMETVDLISAIAKSIHWA